MQKQEQALAAFEPRYIMVAQTEQGYLDIADKIRRAGLLPKGMDVGQAAISMMMGAEYGLSPLKSINGFAVINGRPAPFGPTLRGICEDHTLQGDLTGCMQGVGEMRHVATEDPEGPNEVDFELGEALRRAVRRRLARLGWVYDAESRKWSQETKSDVPGHYRCGFAVLKRKGRPVRVELFDSIEAHAAGLLGKSGPWSQYPQRMLEARAVTFALRALYADKLAGLDITAEELDGADQTPPKPPASATVLDELAGAPKPATTSAPVDAEFTERPRETSAPQPAAETKPEKPPTGADLLRTIAAKIKGEGGTPNDLHEDACRRAGVEVKSARVMTDTEMRKVAAALEAIWTERAAQPSLPTGDGAAS